VREIRAAATSAVREASNRGEFLALVQAAAGVRVEVLSDIEEARLIHLGVSRGFPLRERVACIIDIGGGSTECIIGDGEHPFLLRSLKAGSLRLYEEFFGDATTPGPKALRAMRERIEEVIEPLALEVAAYPFETMIGTSGTITGLAALDAARAVGPGSSARQRVHGYLLHRERLALLQKDMLRMSPAQRKKMPGMNPRRSDIIVAGNALLIALMERLDRTEIVVSERALRDGMIVEYLEGRTETVCSVGEAPRGRAWLV
jgi:exopolyphosphatase/guanosine-5'-triphosphate,3'-diphosphate pyrophosphatase